MTGRSGARDTRRTDSDEELDARLRDPRVLAWMDANVTELRRSLSDQRILRTSLVIGFVVGLAAHIGGYLLKSTATTEPLGLIADLLYALGFALWTGVVVVLFVQVFPETKRRQIKQLLDAYDAGLPNKPDSRGNKTSGDDQAPSAR